MDEIINRPYFYLSLHYMRDLIWTVIVIWVVYKIVDVFRSINQKKNPAYQQERSQNANSPTPKKDLKSGIQKMAEKDGEYVDYEEVK